MTALAIGLVLAVVAAGVVALHRYPRLSGWLLGDQPCPDQAPAGREMCWVELCTDVGHDHSDRDEVWR